MIVDVHTHLSTLEQWGPTFTKAFARAFKSRSQTIDLAVTPERHWQSMKNVDRAIVFGINSLALGMHTPNESIAEYSNAHSDKIIGFMSIDPNSRNALEELDYCVKTLGLQGIKMSPVYQDYHPSDERARRVHRRAEQLGLPILTHAAFHSISSTRMELANPLLYDPVAREFPNLKIVLAHIGLPWFQDAMVMVRKHENVYADVSPAFHRGWLYQALAMFQEFDVSHKLLLGSDFPISSSEQVIDCLQNINQIVEGTELPRIESGLIEEIIHRDSLTLLGLR